MDEYDLANNLFGSSRLESDASATSTETVLGTAVSDSADGIVSVVLEGDVTAIDANGSEGDNVIEMETSPAVKKGDTVLISLVGGTGMTPTVTAVVGSGDRTDATATEAADTAAKASDAAAEASEAAAKAIIETVTEYAVSEAPTDVPESGWSTETPEYKEGQYTWMRHTVTYGDGRTDTTAPALITGNDGTSVTVKSTEVSYQASDSGTDIPGGEWSDTVPTVAQGQYLWIRTVVTYSPSGSLTSYSVSYHAKDGEQGASVTALTIQYYSSTSSTTQTGGTWTSSVPEWLAGHYIWQRTVSTIGGVAKYGTPVLYGVMNSIAEDVEGNTSKLTQTANALGLEFGDETATGTLIKASDEGIEVGKSTDGSTFDSTHTKMGTDAFSVHDKEHNELASFGADGIALLNSDIRFQVDEIQESESYTYRYGVISGESTVNSLGMMVEENGDTPSLTQMAVVRTSRGYSQSLNNPNVYVAASYNDKTLSTPNVASIEVESNDSGSTMAMVADSITLTGKFTPPRPRFFFWNQDTDTSAYDSIGNTSSTWADFYMFANCGTNYYASSKAVYGYKFSDLLTYVSRYKVKTKVAGWWDLIFKGGVSNGGTSASDRVGVGIFVGGSEVSCAFQQAYNDGGAAHGIITRRMCYIPSGTEIKVAMNASYYGKMWTHTIHTNFIMEFLGGDYYTLDPAS